MPLKKQKKRRKEGACPALPLPPSVTCPRVTEGRGAARSDREGAGEHWGSRARRKDSGAQAVSQPPPLPGCACCPFLCSVAKAFCQGVAKGWTPLNQRYKPFLTFVTTAKPKCQLMRARAVPPKGDFMNTEVSSFLFPSYISARGLFPLLHQCTWAYVLEYVMGAGFPG